MNQSVIAENIKKAIDEGCTPSLVLLVSKNSEIVYHDAFGFLSNKSMEKATKTTCYDLASLTKPLITSVAIMLLIEQGRIEIGEKIEKYLPEFVGNRKEQITIGHLLSNSAGLPSYRPYYKRLLEMEAYESGHILCKKEAKENIYRFICNESLDYEPGTRSLYSDLGFMLLGFLVEKVSGLTLDEYCEKWIFRPLGLVSTFFNDLSRREESKSLINKFTFAPTEECPWRKKLLYGEVHDDNAYAMGGVAGHAGLFSTASDIHILVKALYESYSKDCHDNFISSAIINMFFKKQDIVGSTWRLGWDSPSAKNSTAGNLFSDNSIGHTGFTGTSLWIDLRQSIWIIVLSNRVSPTRDNNKFRQFRPKLHDIIMRWILEDNEQGNE